MKDKRKPVVGILVTAIAGLLFTAMLAYVVCYFAMSTFYDTYSPFSGEPVLLRRFPHPWQVTIFTPLEKVEGWVRGKDFLGIDYPPPISREVEEAK